MEPYWAPVDPDLHVRDLEGQGLLLLRRDGPPVLYRVRRRGPLPHAWERYDFRRPWLTLGRPRLAQTSLRRATGFDPRLHEGLYATPDWGLAPRARSVRALVSVALATGVVAAAGGLTDRSFLVILPWLALFLVCMWVLPRVGPLRVDSVASTPLTSANLVEYARRRIAGATARDIELLPHVRRVRARIDRIRDEYARLRSDVVERIDHPALFDGTDPHTANLLATLVQVDEQGDDVPVAALEELATELEMAFAVARRNAEVRGIDHVPAAHRDEMRRAAKIARLVDGASTDGERTAALHQLNQVLRSLALHYLPTFDEVRAIEVDGLTPGRRRTAPVPPAAPRPPRRPRGPSRPGARP